MGACNITKLTVDGFHRTNGVMHAIYVTGTSAIGHLIVSNAYVSISTTSSYYLFKSDSTGKVNRLTFRDVKFLGPTANGGMVQTTANNLDRVDYISCEVTGGYWALGDFSSTTLLNVMCLAASSVSGIAHAATTGALTIDGSNLESNVYNCGRTGSGTVRSRGLGIRVDIGTLFGSASGDAAINTNAARSSGAGPVAHNGTNWVHLGSGATF
jgi:hypothetical protein